MCDLTHLLNIKESLFYVITNLTSFILSISQSQKTPRNRAKIRSWDFGDWNKIKKFGQSIRLCLLQGYIPSTSCFKSFLAFWLLIMAWLQFSNLSYSRWGVKSKERQIPDNLCDRWTRQNLSWPADQAGHHVAVMNWFLIIIFCLIRNRYFFRIFEKHAITIL